MPKQILSKLERHLGYIGHCPRFYSPSRLYTGGRFLQYANSSNPAKSKEGSFAGPSRRVCEQDHSIDWRNVGDDCIVSFYKTESTQLPEFPPLQLCPSSFLRMSANTRKMNCRASLLKLPKIIYYSPKTVIPNCSTMWHSGSSNFIFPTSHSSR